MADTSDTADVVFKKQGANIQVSDASVSDASAPEARRAQAQSRQAAAMELLKTKGGDMSTEEYLATRAAAGGKGSVLSALGSGALGAGKGKGKGTTGATGTTGTAEAPTYDFTGVLNLLAARAGRS